jgi:GWxTD domain-containing protein
MKIFTSKDFENDLYSNEDANHCKRRKSGKFTNFLGSVLTGFSLLFPCYSYAIEEKRPTPYEIALAEAFSLMEKDAIKEWIKGPVRYIARYEDETEYKNLETDEERLDFIYKFWLKRDPSPWTLRNEYRLHFWERVKFSNNFFTESTKPGWRTDRGKIYILLGPPDDIENMADVDYHYRHDPSEDISLDDADEDYQESNIAPIRRQIDDGRAEHPFRDTRESGHRGMERWIYRARKNLDTDPYLVVPFYKEASGEFVLSGNPEHYAKATPYLKVPDYTLPDALPIEVKALMDQITTATALNEMKNIKYDIGHAIDVASGEKALEQIVETLEFFEPLRSEPDFHYFPSVDSKNYVLLSVDFNLNNFYKGEIAEDAIIPVALFGKAISREEQLEYMFTSDDSVPKHLVREGDKASIMASFYAPPGKYSISGGLQEMVSGRILNFQKEIEVPDLESCELGISNYALAQDIEEEVDELSPLPFGMNVIPKVNNEFHKDGDFAIYYQICGLGIDEQTGKKSYNLTYQFYEKEDERLIKLGEAVFEDRYQAEQGWSFPLGKWPSGEYVLQIEIHDNVKSESAVYSVDFKVMD